jgi:hypothetical protein
MPARWIAAASLSLLVALPAAAQRGPPPAGDSGFVLSARLGVGFPGGEISDDLGAAGEPVSPSLDELVEWKIPLWFELGYRFNPRIWMGLFLEAAAAEVEDRLCPTGRECDAYDLRLGLDLQFHLAPRATVDPWLGFGFAVELLVVEETGGAAGDGGTTFAGIEFPLVEGGLDVELSPRFSLGPWAAVSLGQFTSRTTELGGSDRRDPIDDRALHWWYQGGVKATIKL